LWTVAATASSSGTGLLQWRNIAMVGEITAAALVRLAGQLRRWRRASRSHALGTVHRERHS